ncbi:MAG: ATP-binding protein [Synergistes sp.]|nr:ATP-binding protein [Synergistes sp.]
MGYIKRDIETAMRAAMEDYPCIIAAGPRQVGKTTLLKNMSEEGRDYVTLDDFGDRALAKNDPALFLSLHKPPVLIDEVQYAPELFPYIKIAADNGAPASSFWLTGSQTFSLMSLAQESLAGRCAVFRIPSLSQHEIYGTGENSPFTLSLDALNERRFRGNTASVSEIFRRIWRGSMPGHISGKFKDRDIFYSSYIQTYIERDVSEAVDIANKFQFTDFIRAAACRTSQMLNIHSIAADVGISDDTAKRWLHVLEKSGVIFYLHPYSANLLKRTVKTPKMYFFDTGLTAYLTKYTSPEILEAGAINGALLENYVVAELRKSWTNAAKDCPIWYYRDKNSREIDIIMEFDGELHPIEIKKTINPDARLIRTFEILDSSVSVPRGTGAVLCMRESISAFDAQNFIVPVWMI